MNQKIFLFGAMAAVFTGAMGLHFAPHLAPDAAPVLDLIKIPTALAALAGVAGLIALQEDVPAALGPALRVVTAALLGAGAAAALWRTGADYVGAAAGAHAAALAACRGAARCPESSWAAVGVARHLWALICAAGPWPLVARVWPAAAMMLVLLFQWRYLVSEPLLPWIRPWRRRRQVERFRRRKGWLAKEMVAKLKRSDGIPLGAYRGALLKYNPQFEKADDTLTGGHHAIIAGTRAGKTAACIMTAVLHPHDGPIVATDIKGEIFAVCHKYRESLGRRQIAINPYRVGVNTTSCLNPMDYLRPHALRRDALLLADGLISPSERTAEYIGINARQIVAVALELAATIAPPSDRHLLTIKNMLLGPNADFEEWQRTTICSGRVAEMGARICNMDNRMKDNVFSHIGQCLDWLNDDSVRDIITSSDFDWDELLDSKIDLYVIVPQDQIGPLAGFLRVFMNMALGAVTRQDGRRKAKDKILMALDEFTRFGRMEKILEIATVSAGGGVEAIFVVQDIGTLENVYGDAAHTLLGSCATTRVFSIGAGDKKTSDWAVSAMAKSHIEKRQSVSKKGGETTTGTSEQKVLQLEASDIRRLPKGYALCLFRSLDPLLIELAPYYLRREYEGRHSPNPTLRA